MNHPYYLVLFPNTRTIPRFFANSNNTTDRLDGSSIFSAERRVTIYPVRFTPLYVAYFHQLVETRIATKQIHFVQERSNNNDKI